MQTADFIIAGQGVAGSLLAMELSLRGMKVIIVDNENNKNTASLIAGAVLNPYKLRDGASGAEQGQQYRETIAYYKQLQTILQVHFIRETPLLLFGNEGREVTKDFTMLCGEPLQEVYMVSPASLLDAVKSYLQQRHTYVNEMVDPADIIYHTNACEWKGYFARKVIFCEGAAASGNKFFQKLPFTRNKGEALLVHIPGLSQGYIYHFNSRLVPIGEGLFWCGTNHVWNYEDLAPDRIWREQQEEILSGWLRIPFSVRQHLSAERPTTAGQFPFIGLHPANLMIGIMNGLGSKGFTLAPYYAVRFADYLCEITSTIADYDNDRMKKLWNKALP